MWTVKQRARLAHETYLEKLYIMLKSIRIKALLAFGAFALAGFVAFPAIATTAPASTQTIKITAHQWAFSPSTITVDVNHPVKLVMTSTDVTHGIASAALGIPNTQISKGKTSTVTFTPKKVGTYKVQCSLFCGLGHADMILTVKVLQ